MKTSEQLTLWDESQIYVIHCFFNCGHLTQSADAQEAHDLMEKHYAEKHTQQIERIIRRL